MLRSLISDSAMERVLGIGVAVRVITSTPFFSSFNFSFCLTPNRCLTIVGVWIGTSIAHDLKGWRTFLLPVIYILTTIVAIVFILAALQGISVTLDGMMEAFGLAGS